MRGYVLGTSGSGKTTFSAKIAEKLELDHLELDSLRHQANWTPLPDEEMRVRVRALCDSDRWIIDGNYSFVRDIILTRATDVFLLDYSRSVVMRRIILRTLSRMLWRKELWNGNREDWRFLFKLDPEENVVLWAWTTFSERRRNFDRLILDLPKTINVYRFRSPSETRRWLDQLES